MFITQVHGQPPLKTPAALLLRHSQQNTRRPRITAETDSHQLNVLTFRIVAGGTPPAQNIIVCLPIEYRAVGSAE
jgi:hypothetical protein